MYDKIKNLLENAYAYAHLDGPEGYNVVPVIINDFLKKEPVENEYGIVRHISINPDEYEEIKGKREEELVKNIFYKSTVEIMLKVNVSRFSLLKSMKIAEAVCADLDFYIGFWNVNDDWTSDIYYKSKYMFMSETYPKSHTDTLSYLIIAESPIHQFKFSYPTVKRYAAPVLMFHPLGYTKNVIQQFETLLQDLYKRFREA